MKDRQTAPAGALGRIPVLSPVLHWMTVPVIVFLRSGFGFSFLGPKSVFLSCMFPVVLFFIYARTEPGEWERWWALSSFGIAASLLYTLHLAAAFERERKRTGAHDHDAGTSHLLRLLSSEANHPPRLELAVYLFLEPALVLLTGLVLRTALSERFLSGWLMLVAGAMWVKAFINWWYGVRSEKKHTDIMDDAREKMADGGAASKVRVPNAAGRRERERKPRAGAHASSADSDGEERRFAEILRLMPPLSLEQAERNYRALMKQYHPDSLGNNSADGGKAAAELNAAIEFFREQKD